MRLYFHIPFCRANCSYCDFYFTTQTKHIRNFFEALQAEIALRKAEWQTETIQSIYFGGGTPSLPDPEFIESVLETLSRNAKFHPGAEITLEANPEDLTKEKLIRWKKAGINRLSIGIQSFRNEDLHLLNRRHTKELVERGLDNVVQAGFNNLTGDLIYGIPGLDLKNWENNIRKMLSYGFNHLSAYALTAEKNTLLEYQIRQGKIRMPDDEDFLEQFNMLREILKEIGFEHYEISNWAKPGFQAAHNTAYWHGEAYAGFGPAAHSYDGLNQRRHNVANIHYYIRNLSKGKPYFETEMLTDRDRYNEYILTRLRLLQEGIPGEEIKRLFPRFYTHFRKQAEELLDTGQLTCENDRWKIHKDAVFLADSIISGLMF